jgi:putative ABC transport system substrate-binding protein
VIEYRSAEGNVERLPELAAELVALHVDIIVTLATTGALAAKKATNKIPIVVAAMADPARDGLVASLARPGGNITGSTFLGPELIPKRLGLVKEVVPRASRVAVLWHPGVYSEPTMQDMLKETKVAAQWRLANSKACSSTATRLASLTSLRTGLTRSSELSLRAAPSP